MLKRRRFWYLLLCILMFLLPFSCDIQKRRYLPGYFVQSRKSPERFHIPSYYVSRRPKTLNYIDSVNISLGFHSIWGDYIDDSDVLAKTRKYPAVSADCVQLSPKVPYNETLAQPERINGTKWNEITHERSDRTISKNEKRTSISEYRRKNENENLIIALLSGAGFILLFFGASKGIRRYQADKLRKYGHSNPNDSYVKTKQEIANIADKLDRCADRFANAKNKEVELAARKVAFAVSKCTDIKHAKELEKSFHNIYLAPSSNSAMQHLKQNNLRSNDAAYGVGTLKPDVVTTAGGYFKNSAGSLSWTIGEPISETFSDGSDFLTQGFQQGSYFITSVVDEGNQSEINVTVYPNPFTTIVNIKLDTNESFKVETINLQGSLINSQSFENGEGQIDFSSLSDAIYLLRVFDKDGNQIKVFKIQKVD